MRIGVNGATGRMGRTVCAAVSAEPDLDLVAAVDPFGAGQVVEGVVDFTVAVAARDTLPWLADHGIHGVVGTTGFAASDFELFESAFAAPEGPNCVIAPNFAISAVLMMRFAEMAAPFFDTAEIIELHHDRKIDAPSGTALKTADRMAAARPDAFEPDPTTDTVYEGARGGGGPAGIRVHSVRMRGMVAHQEVILGATGQTLTIRQDSYDRESFMPGVILACRKISSVPGLSRSLDPFL
jgi:4-hydroxy-tetrahydrodipicolinate reductase